MAKNCVPALIVAMALILTACGDSGTDARTATVTATTELTTLKITKDIFFRMVTDFPEMGVEVMRVLAHRLENTTADLMKARAAARS